MSERKNILIVGVEKTAVVKAAVAKLSGDYGIIVSMIERSVPSLTVAAYRADHP